MMISRLLVPVTAAVLLTAATALAQTPQIPPPDPTAGTLTAGRPFRGIFGGGLQDTEQTLTFTGSTGGGYESAYLAAIEGAEDAGTLGQNGGPVGVGSASLAYSLGRPRAGVSASISSSAFYYDQVSSNLTHSHRVQANEQLQIARRTRLTSSQYATHQPFRLDRLFSGTSGFSFGAPPPLPTDTFAGGEEYLDMGADVDLGQQISERVSMGLGYTYHSSQWQAESRRIFQGARGGMNLSLTRGLSLRLGYGHYQ